MHSFERISLVSLHYITFGNFAGPGEVFTIHWLQNAGTFMDFPFLQFSPLFYLWQVCSVESFYYSLAAGTFVELSSKVLYQLGLRTIWPLANVDSFTFGTSIWHILGVSLSLIFLNLMLIVQCVPEDFTSTTSIFAVWRVLLVWAGGTTSISDASVEFPFPWYSCISTMQFFARISLVLLVAASISGLGAPLVSLTDLNSRSINAM